ncbi:unnamed protein product [Nezara viridula]|uniref:F-box domain-containing protein n=1 Tax=Nezara viridula TaxID=85310 RepID=A0A9P0MMS8_NEZVI|nr:unnamed protein product [Nezara viridula]
MMDIVSEVPIEISIHILSYLSYRDLINCFKVCRGWRDLANCNLLWKKHCFPYATSDEIRKAISRVVRPRPTADFVKNLSYCLRSRDNLPSRNCLGPWCGCARLFKYKYGRHLHNWKNGNFIFSQMVLREPEFNVVCSGRSLTLCFYQSHMFAIAELSPNGIEEVKYLDIPLPQQGQYDSVQVSTLYLVVSHKNVILVYKKSSGDYVYYKTFVLHNDYQETQEVRSFNHASTSKDRSFIVSFISGHYAWFRSVDHIYVIHLESGTVKKFVFENANIKHDNRHKVVAWSKGHIKILTDYGNLMYQRHTRSQICDVAFDETFTLLCKAKKNPKAYIEWWDPQTAKRRILKRVEGKTSMVVHGENVYILEVKRQSYHRVSAIHSISGITYWIHTVTTDNLALNRFPESIIFEGICGKYLFIHVPSLGNKKYYIIDMNAGVGLYSKEFGEGKAYLFNEKVVVIARREVIWIMNYL